MGRKLSHLLIKDHLGKKLSIKELKGPSDKLT
jgi:hypothetical protein